MNTFLRTFTIWLSIFLMLTGILCFVNAGFLKTWAEQVPEKAPDILFLGDSHAQTAIHPDIFPDALNMAQSSEELVFTYYKLKHMLRVCPELDTVAISLSFHTLLHYEEKVPAFADESMMRYALLLEDYEKIDEWNKLKSFWLHILYWKLGLPNKFIWDYTSQAYRKAQTFEKAPYRGGYISHEEAHIDSADINEIMKRHFFPDGDKACLLSHMQLYYLQSMIQLCRSHEVVLIFYNSPVSKKYAQAMPLQYAVWLQAAYAYLNRQEGCFVFDYHTAMESDGHFYDHDHLNLKGAKLFSEKLRASIDRLSN